MHQRCLLAESRCVFCHSAPLHPSLVLLRPSLDSLDSRRLRGCAFSRDNQTHGCRSTCSAECQAASHRCTMMTPPIESRHAGHSVTSKLTAGRDMLVVAFLVLNYDAVSSEADRCKRQVVGRRLCLFPIRGSTARSIAVENESIFLRAT
jgi:hypothetical protein